MNKPCIAMLFLLFIAGIDCSITDNNVVSTGCEGENFTLDWEYSDAGNMNTVKWEFISGTTTTIILIQSATSAAAVQNSFNVEPVNNGEIKLTNLTSANIGTYKITVTYTSATPTASDTFEVTAVHDAPTGLSYTDVGSVVTCSATSLGSPAAQLYLKVDGTDTSLTSDTIEGSGKAVECCLKGDSIECMTTSPCVTVRSTTTSTTKTPTSATTSSSASISLTSTSTSKTPTYTSSTLTPTTTASSVTSSASTTHIIHTTFSRVSSPKSPTTSTEKVKPLTTATSFDSSSSETVVIIVASVVGGLFVVGIVITIILMLLSQQKRRKHFSKGIHTHEENKNTWQYQRSKSASSLGHLNYGYTFYGKSSGHQFRQNPLFVRQPNRPVTYQYQPWNGNCRQNQYIYPGLSGEEQYRSGYVVQDKRVNKASTAYNAGYLRQQYYSHPHNPQRSYARNPNRETLHTHDQNYVAADYSVYW